jgi:hypothetical protein
MNYRISNSLFESIVNATNPQVEEPAKVEEAEVDKAHFCATHVEHAMLGLGTCISEQHAEPDEQGQIAWYTVEFPTGTHRIQTSNLRIVEGKSHTHSKKMAEAEENIEEGNDGNLANNAKPYDKVTRGDVIAGRLGKDEMGGKKKVVKEEEKIDEAGMGHAGSVTMKQVNKSNATPQVKAAIKKSAPDIKSYADRAAALTAAGIKRESVEDLDEVKMADLPSRKIQGRSYGASKPEPSAFDILKGPRAKDLKPAPASKALKTKAIKEGITQTIINYDDFRIDVTDNPTYGDYLRALQTMVESRDESIQQEVIAIATAAYDEKIDSIIIESKAREIFAGKLDEFRKTGAKVLDENYVVESNSTYVEYTVEKDGVRTQYVHIGTNGNK